MQTWVTKQLMQEELDSRTWFSKNIWNRKEAKAMRDYIANANTVLENANHIGDQVYFEGVLNAMLSKGYEKIDDMVEHKMNSFKGEFERNDRALREIADRKEREQQEQKAKEDAAKLKEQQANQRKEEEKQKREEVKKATDAIKKKFKDDRDAIKEKSANDKLFDVRFVPSYDKKAFDSQMSVMNKMTDYLNKKDIPESARNVFLKNAEKLNLMKEYHDMSQEATAKELVDKVNSVADGLEKISNDLKAANEGYVPYTYDELKKAPDKVPAPMVGENANAGKEPVIVDLDNNEKQNNEISPMIEDQELNKGAMVKDQI